MVKQDSGELREIAGIIEAHASEFNTARDEMFQEMATQLTTEDESSAWWGPQAMAFLQNFQAKEPDFENAYNNIVSMAENLTEQAIAWENFENV